MSYKSTTKWHRDLTDDEEAQFVAYAQANDPEHTDIPGWFMYHPVCRRTWTQRGVGPEADPAFKTVMAQLLKPDCTCGSSYDHLAEDHDELVALGVIPG